MKASELRIGNLIHRYKQRTKVTLLTLTYIENNPHPYSYIELIPEWLERMGFEIDDDAGNWGSPDHKIYKLENSSFGVGIKGDYIGWHNQVADDFYTSYYPELKYVHQLQNLYFALTSKELTIAVEETVNV